MGPSENPPGEAPLPSATEPGKAELERLQSAVRSLSLLLNVVMVALVVLVASLFSFMLRERAMVRRQIEENSRYIADYKSRVEPRLSELNSKLFAYSKLHTNFTPILIKYFGATNVAAAGTGATSAASIMPDGGTQPAPAPSRP